MDSTKSKRTFSVILALALALAVLMPPALAFARGNWYDKWYSVASSGHGYTWTPSEGKWDYTSSWDQCIWANSNHTAQIGTQYSYNGTVYFHTQPISWSQGKSGYIVNMVKENGGSYACLWVNGPANIAVSGYWSPDSI